MPTVRDRRPLIDLGTLPKLPSSDVRLLWVNDFYDAPLEAIVEHRGARCLLALHDHDALAGEGPLHWIVFTLSPEQIADEQRWHDLFAEHVGEHWCFHPEAHAHGPTPTATPERFYDAYKQRPPMRLEASAALGWLDELPQR